MIFDEVPKQSWVSTICSYRVNHVIQAADAPTGRLKSIEQLVIARSLVTHEGTGGGCLHWVIQNTIEIVLIWAGICRIPIQDLSNTVYTCSIIIAGPERLLNMLHSVNAQPVDLEIVSLILVDLVGRLTGII